MDPRFVRPLWRGRTNVDALTIAALEAAEKAAGHEFVVTQGSYQPVGQGSALSANTHRGGGVVDLVWCGHDACIGHLRRAGLWAWHRVPPSFTHHIHAVVVGHPLLHQEAADQIAEARLGGDGLRGSAPDNGPSLPVVPPKWPVEPAAPVNAAEVREARRLINQALRALRKVAPHRGKVHKARKAIRESVKGMPKQ